MRRANRGQDLRGCDFAGQCLARASLAGADLRAADFTGADLRDADLREARTGMRRGWAAAMVSVALAISIGAGVAAGYAGRLLQHVIQSRVPGARALGAFVAASLAVLLLTAAIRGLRVAFARVLPAIAALAALGMVIAVASGVGTGHGLLVVVAFLIVVAAILVLATLARLVAGGVSAFFFLVVAVSGVLGSAAIGGGLTATAIAVAAMVAGRRALHGASGFPRLVRVASEIAVRGGTRFAGADLRGARLTRAHLYACDFRGAKLEGARLDDAELRLSLFDGEPPVVPRSARSHVALRPRTP
jgi:hypothetical protein